jgi:hypothetical protein
MYIPKKSRFELLLKRKSSISNWSGICTEFIKDVVLRRRTNSIATIQDDQKSNHQGFLNDPNLCLDQLSEFQKSYVSFPEFNESTISSESDNDSTTSTRNNNVEHYWVLSSTSASS